MATLFSECKDCKHRNRPANRGGCRRCCREGSPLRWESDTAIQAIQTLYDGIVHRSRVEARFAILLDCLDVRFEYELQGYTLADGSHYLPDFFLPAPAWFVEIKGTSPSTPERRKCQLLAQGTGHPVLLMVGEPVDPIADYSELPFRPAPITVFLADGSMRSAHHWNSCTGCEGDYAAGCQLLHALTGSPSAPCESTSKPMAQQTISEAFVAARSARFEHGEQTRRAVAQ